MDSRLEVPKALIRLIIQIIKGLIVRLGSVFKK